MFSSYIYTRTNVGQEPGVVTWHSHMQRFDVRARERNKGRKVTYGHTYAEDDLVQKKDVEPSKSISQRGITYF